MRGGRHGHGHRRGRLGHLAISWLVHGTIILTGTVSVADTNAKVLLLTAVPMLGAPAAGVGAGAAPDAEAGALAVAWPTNPSVVVTCERTLIDGLDCGLECGPEQPETSTTVAARPAGSAASVS